MNATTVQDINRKKVVTKVSTNAPSCLQRLEMKHQRQSCDGRYIYNNFILGLGVDVVSKRIQRL